MKVVNKASHSPDIPVRQMDFAFDKSTPKYWAADNPYATLFMTALSASFPGGEMGFVRSVRHYEPNITNKELLAQVKSFIGQEAHHSKEHAALNQFMEQYGLPVSKLENKINKRIIRFDSILPPAMRLANTCSLEHFTALFAEQLMEKPDFFEKLHPSIRALWLWHAIEESEHKSVAYDVFKDQVGSYPIRVLSLLQVTVFFTFFMGKNSFELIKADGKLTDVRSALKAVKLLVGKQGFLSGLLPKYLAYYKPNFHPSHTDSSALRQQTLALLEAMA
jgi:hypothetical protein